MAEAKQTSLGKAVWGSSPDRLAATLAFDANVGQVRAVSDARAASLGKMGIHTVRDLLTHFPRRYIDMSKTATIADARIGSSCTVAAEVYELKLKQPRRNLSLVEVTLIDNTGTMIVTCFRQPWLADRLHKGDVLTVSGKVEFNYGYKRMTNPFMEAVEDVGQARGVIVPVHPATEKINTAWMRRLVSNALEACGSLDDPLPLALRTRYRLMSRQSALRTIHFPTAMEEAHQARRRLAYEELLLLELHLLIRGGMGSEQGPSTSHVVDGPHTRALEQALPFQLTDEQHIARAQIADVLSAPRRANHMLLGDVGTGKTVVAAFALAAAADTGTQALMMAPTEVLAVQYADALGGLLDASDVTWGLLTGSTPPQERESIVAGLADGCLTVLFGTHALLEENIAPRNCTVVIVDEQQRFGVDQRQRLADKGPAADVLSLTATPIPRSLALALYGDMTLSYLHQRPNNLAPTQTRVFAARQAGDAYDLALKELEAGHQVYVVCPLVGDADTAKDAGKRKGKGKDDDVAEEEDYAFSRIAIEWSDDYGADDPKAALRQARFLEEKVLCGFEVGVLHGKMKSAQKRRVMQDFRDNRIQVLVSTTVIEVGVDVPNATVMIVEDADRFGLAQLHQLRGRVGRGSAAGYMCLISGSKSPVALERLAAMERTDDGFELAEYDLSLRREGDILGNRQHGASALKLVNVVRDALIVEAAHSDALDMLREDPNLQKPEHLALKYELARVFPTEGER
ncbi:MAG: ATP-dependent DNA helicase RecG [Eggerthellaceae bacterium]|nr:ATP-dependent DNA helicase RecG [Eggerthellaceae bacterium]